MHGTRFGEASNFGPRMPARSSTPARTRPVQYAALPEVPPGSPPSARLAKPVAPLLAKISQAAVCRPGSPCARQPSASVAQHLRAGLAPTEERPGPANAAEAGGTRRSPPAVVRCAGGEWAASTQRRLLGAQISALCVATHDCTSRALRGAHGAHAAGATSGGCATARAVASARAHARAHVRAHAAVEGAGTVPVSGDASA